MADITMTCHDFEDRFDDYIEGALAGIELDAARRHLSGCAPCRELIAIESRARAGIATLTTGDAVDISGGVIARTTGSTCPSAHALLPDDIDGHLERSDAGAHDLLTRHLENCEACSALGRTLSWMTRALPLLAECEPDASFTADVVRATTESGRRGAAWAGRLGSAWRNWIDRPRFAIEGAYIGSMILWLVFAAPISPVHGMPARMLELVRSESDPVALASVVDMPRFITNPAVAGRDALSSTGGWILESTAPVRTAWRARLEQAGVHAHEFGRQGLNVGGKLIEGDFAQSAVHVKSMGTEAREIWRILRGARTTRPDAPSPATRAKPTRPTKEA